MLCLAPQRSSGSCGTQDAGAGGSVNNTQGDVGAGPLSTGEPVDEAPENDSRRTIPWCGSWHKNGSWRKYWRIRVSLAGALGQGQQRPDEHLGTIRGAAAMLPSKFNQVPPSSAPVKAAGGGRRMVSLDAAVDCIQCCARPRSRALAAPRAAAPRRAALERRRTHSESAIAVGASPWVS